MKISVVTPTKDRQKDISLLIENLKKSNYQISELIIVDASEDFLTSEIVSEAVKLTNFKIKYFRKVGGPAVQRNFGVLNATSEIISFLDDDIRVSEDYFNHILKIFNSDTKEEIGGVAGYISNQYVDMNKTTRWIWYKKLRLFSTYEPGKYDYKCGYPINRYGQSPYSGTREIDFMGSGCANWRKKVFDDGIKFSMFFKEYSILEDAHFALQAAKSWKILECGDAHCFHYHSGGAHRKQYFKIGQMTAINYYYVFKSTIGSLSIRQKYRFLLVQFFDLFRAFLDIFRFRTIGSIQYFFGKSFGIILIFLGKI
jgi:glycosyltransferase involved in cell wall biosynthesis